MKNNKGFSLVELIVVVIIVSVLSFISFSIFKEYKKEAKMAEGKALLSALVAAEEIYYAKNFDYFADTTGFIDTVSSSVTGSSGISAKKNKYFKSFKFTKESNNIIIQTRDTKNQITMQVKLYPNNPPEYSNL